MVTVKGSAKEACGTETSITTYSVKKDEHESGRAASDDSLPSIVSDMTFEIPGASALPPGTGTATIQVRTKLANGRTILVIKLPRLSVQLAS
jgi:hypothetical protein